MMHNESAGFRQLLLSLAVAVLVIIAVIVWNVVRQPPEGPTTYMISMTDYQFSPSEMTWRVGEKVTITLINQSQSKPGKPHEFMVGRDPNVTSTVFGPQQGDGFATSPFTGVTVDLMSGQSLTQLDQGSSKFVGVDPMKLLLPGAAGMQGMPGMGGTGGMGGMGGMGGTGGMQMAGFMPVLAEGGQLTFSFTVPDKPGQWTYGCFQQSGQHFLNGMQGTVTILPA